MSVPVQVQSVEAGHECGAWLERAPGTARGPLQPCPSLTAHHNA
ncbi:hypothetical protein [Streptomyces sp. NPDC045369]